jgi:hypothetical protein
MSSPRCTYVIAPVSIRTLKTCNEAYALFPHTGLLLLELREPDHARPERDVVFHGARNSTGLDANVAIACPSETVTSTGGIRISAQQPLEFANDADAVLFGGSPRSRQIVEGPAIMSRLKLASVLGVVSPFAADAEHVA